MNAAHFRSVGPEFIELPNLLTRILTADALQLDPKPRSSEAFPIKTIDNPSRIAGPGLISLERTLSGGRRDQTMSALRTEAPYPRDVSVQLDLRHSRPEHQDRS